MYDFLNKEMQNAQRTRDDSQNVPRMRNDSSATTIKRMSSVISSSTQTEENTFEKLKKYSDDDLSYDDIQMGECDVTAYFAAKDQTIGKLDTKIKLKKILRYQHLARDYVDESDYPPNAEYFLYSDDRVGILYDK